MHQALTYARRGLGARACGFVLKHSAADELLTALRHRKSFPKGTEHVRA